MIQFNNIVIVKCLKKVQKTLCKSFYFSLLTWFSPTHTSASSSDSFCFDDSWIVSSRKWRDKIEWDLYKYIRVCCWTHDLIKHGSCPCFYVFISLNHALLLLSGLRCVHRLDSDGAECHHRVHALHQPLRCCHVVRLPRTKDQEDWHTSLPTPEDPTPQISQSWTRPS